MPVYLGAMKFLTTLFCLVCMVPTFGQMYFDMGLKGAYGPTFLYNSNIYDDGQYDAVLNSGYGIGGKLGVHFNSSHGITFDYMNASSKQEFDVRGVQQPLRYTWKHHDLLLLYRLSGNGAYLELGPKLSLVSDVNQSFTGADADVSNFFVNSYKSVVLGFGSYLMGNELISLQLGVRLHWSLDDMISDDGRIAGYPAPSATYPKYEKSIPAVGQVMLELNYAFGRFAKASCSQRWRLILFE